MNEDDKTLLWAICIFAVFCVILVLAGCTLKYGDKEISFFQMQLRDGSASVYSTKLYGANIEVPVPGGGSINLTPAKFQVGYIAETKGVIPTKPDGELPDVCIDLTQDEAGGFSDTYSTGQVSRQIYPKEAEQTTE